MTSRVRNAQITDPGISARQHAPRPRLGALDSFRGLTVAGMIIVNTPGSAAHVWWPLDHAEWHGFTPTDLVFPAFLCAMGMALGLSFPRAADAQLWRRVAWRVLALIAIGWAWRMLVQPGLTSPAMCRRSLLSLAGAGPRPLVSGPSGAFIRGVGCVLIGDDRYEVAGPQVSAQVPSPGGRVVLERHLTQMPVPVGDQGKEFEREHSPGVVEFVGPVVSNF